MSMPEVSVIMPVYNGEKYLKESIESILNQSFSNFEFIIIDDCSTDDSLRIIEKYGDPRIALVKNEKHMGITRSLNFGISMAKGKYIARMDCDDISMPKRLKKQFLFMEKNKDVGICGSWIETIGDGEGEIWRYPISFDDIKAYLLFASCIIHPSVMIRKKSLGLLKYNENLENAQDYELWTRMVDDTIVVNLPDLLLKYRVNKTSLSNQLKKKNADSIREKFLLRKFSGITKSEIEMHNKISNFNFGDNKLFYSDFVGWLSKLAYLNKKEGFTAIKSFDKIVIYYWLIGTVRMRSVEMLIQKHFWKFFLSILIKRKQALMELFLKRIRMSE